MELFTRDLVLFGPPAETRSWAVGIGAKLGEVIDREVAVWTSIAGGTLGHTTWALPVDGAAELIELSMIALADQDYVAAVEEGRPLFRGTPYDTLYRPYEDIDIQLGAPGNVCQVTRADAAPGRLGDAVGWGLEVAHHVAQLTDVPTILLSSPAGHYSRLTWMAVADDAAAADLADRTSRADDGYRKLIARGGELFVPGSARSQWFLRLG